MITSESPALFRGLHEWSYHAYERALWKLIAYLFRKCYLLQFDNSSCKSPSPYPLSFSLERFSLLHTLCYWIWWHVTISTLNDLKIICWAMTLNAAVWCDCTYLLNILYLYMCIYKGVLELSESESYLRHRTTVGRFLRMHDYEKNKI